MPRVLLVDDDPRTLQGYADVLRCEGFNVLVAPCGRQGLELAQSFRPDVVLSDLRLPDLSAIELLRFLTEAGADAAVVIVTGSGTTRTAVEAIQLRACDYLEKPLIGDDVARVVANVLRHRARRAQSSHHPEAVPVPHAAARWALAVVSTIDSPTDPKQFRGWGRCVGASPGALRHWCRSAGLSPKRSLDFARLLRVVVLGGRSGHRPETLLDVVDERTLRRLCKLGGDIPAGAHVPCNTDEFLTIQRWITDASALMEVKRELQRRRPGHGHTPAEEGT